ncbi:MAG TPA: metallophosphoesterase [bacterium]
MYRIVHLSDLHYSTASREKARSMLAAVAASEPDHLIISGDLTDDGRAVYARGLRSLLTQYGFDSCERLTVVPGNHDMYGFIYRTFSKADGLLAGMRSLRTVKDTVARLRDLHRRLSSYRERDYDRELGRFRSYYERAFDGCIATYRSRSGFPFAKLLPNNLAIIGVDTCFYLPKVYSLMNLLRHGMQVMRTKDVTLLGENLSGSTGWVDLRALESLLNIPEIRRRRKILSLHHCMHPFSFLLKTHSESCAKEMQLVNRSALVDMLRAHRIEMILHGHYHTLHAYYLESGVPVLNSGEHGGSAFFGLEVSAREMDVRLMGDGTAGMPSHEEPSSLA